MMRWLGTLLLLVGTLPALGQVGKNGCPPHDPSPDPAKWTWVDRDCKEHNRAALDEILANHQIWLAKCEKALMNSGDSASVPDDLLNDRQRADLSGFDLTRANLSGANLNVADLSNARLDDANLSLAHLRGANLTEAVLTDADLSGADLSASAPFAGADCVRCVLKGADLSNADLSEVSMQEADFEPKVIPPASGMGDANDLGMMRWNDEPPTKYRSRTAMGWVARFFGFERFAVPGKRKPMLDLRKELHDAGYRDAEVQVNLAIHRMDESWWEIAVFDWTCEWGANWARPIRLVMALGVGCSLVYWALLRFTRRNKLYVIGKKGKREQWLEVGHRGVEHRWAAPEWFAGTGERGWWRRLGSPWKRVRWELRLYWTAALFSLMSVLNLGVQGVDLGRWVRQMHRRDFDLQARGAIRTIAGVQSVLSFALLALAALSYFGHPFE